MTQHIHLVGIGGTGLSAIARVLLEQGYEVSGSDKNSNPQTQALAEDGATIYTGHDANYVNGADEVIISSAVPQDHVEVVAARAQNIPVYKRNDMIARLMQDKTVVAVAGTHGKTTTTSMIVHLLRECGKDPSYIVGGVLGNTGTNAGVGAGNMFVIEADEYDNMFHGLNPNIAVLTSIEYDHPDFFKSEAEMLQSFKTFVDKLPESVSSIASTLIACVDHPAVRDLVDSIPARRTNRVSYGIQPESKVVFRGMNIRSEGSYTHFDLVISHIKVAEVSLAVPGTHNVQNALAALIVVDGLGVLLPEAIAALKTFKSTGRRFDIRGAVDDVIVIDDYAHHPTAIKVTVEAARERYPEHTIWAVWQPHTYSRTQSLLDDYAVVFGAADEVVITDIYAARETATHETITGQQTADAIQHEHVHFTPTLEQTADFLRTHVQSPAVILIMSAGDAPKIGEWYLNEAHHA